MFSSKGNHVKEISHFLKMLLEIKNCVKLLKIIN